MKRTKKEYDYTPKYAAQFINHYECAPQIDEQEMVSADEEISDD